MLEAHLDVSALRFRIPAVLLAYHVFVSKREDVIDNPLLVSTSLRLF